MGTNLESNKNYLRRYLFIFLAIISLYFLHRIYEVDIYKWLCNNEENKAACMVAGMNYKEKGDQELADHYLQKSCELGYTLGCVESGKRAEKIGREKVSRLYFNEACRLGDEKSCSGKEVPRLEEPQ
jgi:TPR repeat protein|tara:strand:+ start:4489 stop:4869 length:381 start_codon:yes stop_codon:yes gene_type:complete